MELVISVVAVVLSIASGGFTFYTFIWTASRDRKQATLEAYNRLQTEVFDNLNKYMPSEICNICNDSKSEEYKKISGYLARIEHFCVGVKTKIYDRNIFFKLAHGYFDGNQLRKRIEPIIQVKNSSKNSKELFYGNTLSILGWMDKKSKKK